MSVGTISIQTKHLRKALSRQLGTFPLQVSHAQGEIWSFIPRIQLNDALQFAFCTREIAFDPISARQFIMRRHVIWPLLNHGLQLCNRLIGLVFVEEVLRILRMDNKSARMAQPSRGAIDQHNRNQEDGDASKYVIGLWSDFGDECAQN